MSDDIREKKKYVRPLIELIELARDPGDVVQAVLQPAEPPTSTSNVFGGVVVGAARRGRGAAPNKR
ncbi:MAG TPA: hypothetical protein VFK05_18395 [Polyangiaceae bacterium]|nr:hypothetical protein [Polyangiaceae bacterium]